MSKYKIVALMGKSASGKDTVLNAFCDKYQSINKIISTTTRPQRDGEPDDSYFFVSSEEFAQKVLNQDMVEASFFRDWCYGTEKKSLNENMINIGVYNPEGIRALLEDSSMDVLCFYVVASDKVRLIRSLNRERNPDVQEIIRRYETDKQDFSDIDFEYKTIINMDMTPISELVKDIKSEILVKWGQK